MALFKSSNKEPEIIRSVSYPYKAHGSRLPARSRSNGVKAKNYGRQISFVFIAGLLGFMFLTPANTSVSHTLGVSVETESASAALKPEPEKIEVLDFITMTAQIDTVIKKYPGMDIGVAWIDIKTGESGSHGVEKPFVAASTGKLFTAIAFLHDVEKGAGSLTDKVGSRDAKSALEAMIVNSDNEAWNDFNNGVKNHLELAEYANSIGFSDYDPDANTITPSSLAKLLSNLHQRRLLNEEHTSLLLSYMERAKEVEYVTSIAPAGIRVFHKPGYLVDRVHDAMIIDNDNRPYSLVIFTKSNTGSYNEQSGVDIFQKIAQSTFNTFLKP